MGYVHNSLSVPIAVLSISVPGIAPVINGPLETMGYKAHEEHL